MSNAMVRLSFLAALGIGSLMAMGPALAECGGHAAQTVATPAQTPVPATTASTTTVKPGSGS